MRCSIFLVFLFFSTSVLFAQGEFFQVISCKGNVSHQLDSGERVEVVPGSKIEAKGKLILSDRCMIKLISKDRPQKLQSAGEYDLSELYYAADVNTMSFTGKFWKYLMNGLNNTDDQRSIKKYGNQSASGGIKGYNKSSEGKVKLTSPIYGKISGGNLNFMWRNKDNNECTFRLLDAKRNVVLEEKVNRDNFEVDLEKAEIVKGKYYWDVSQENEKSNQVMFEYAPLNFEKMKGKLARISDYVEGDGLEKSWIEAVVYEMEGYEYEAGKKYYNLMKSNPKHLLFRKLYVLYLARIGNIDDALKIKDSKY